EWSISPCNRLLRSLEPPGRRKRSELLSRIFFKKWIGRAVHGRNWMIDRVGHELRGLLTGAAALAAVAVWLAGVELNLPAQDVLHSLRFHLGAAMLVVPLALFLAGARWRAAIMMLLIVASLWHGLSVIQAQQSLRQHAGDNGSSFSILSFNVLANSEQG